ncbi:MAG: PEP-CTERM sorting domain-containing protein [Lacipirellulaceae bacterium]
MKTHIAVLSSMARSFALLVACSGSAAFAASINYGDVDDFAGGGIIEYTQVTESSVTDPVPLFSSPDVVVNRLDFDPIGFGASSSGGAPSITDGQLNFGIDVAPGKGITSLTVIEGGDFTIAGLGTMATGINYGLFAKVTITEVSGVAVPAFDVVASTSFNMNLVTNPGLSQPWGAGLLIDLGPAVAAAGYGTSVVTKAEFVLNNTLVATSEAGSLAFLAKKDIYIDTVPLDDSGFIPEPSTALLLAAASVCGLRRRG